MSAGQNVDSAEIDKFQSIASRWWDLDSEFKPLHDINPLRVSYIEKQSAGLTGKSVLDIGCGGGILSEALAEKGAKVCGIDMAEASLKVARLHLHESGYDIDYQLSTIEQFAARSTQQYDVICCLEMLEHVPDPDSIIASAVSLLKPDGTLILSTINRTPKAFALAILGAEYLLRMIPRGTHEYQKFIKPSEMAASLRQNAMQITDLSGMSYHPLGKTYKIGADIDVNYLMTANHI
ncbi:MAG: bifunctional 2-polyprenyl-6-hydroxyphenol methylase/3-demethylubiquinol 3-O-methyltransferase UbiG [Pseudomonadota bacterium]